MALGLLQKIKHKIQQVPGALSLCVSGFHSHNILAAGNSKS